MQQSVGNIIISLLEKYGSNHLDKWKPKDHLLGRRKFLVYNIDKQTRSEILFLLYNKLCNMKITTIKEIRLLDKSLKIKLTQRAPLWYRLGLALSDGSILDKNNIIFSTSKQHTIDAIIYGFNHIRIYIARYMLSTRTNKIIPIINIVVEDPDTALLLKRIKENRLDIEQFTQTLINDKKALAYFLAGIIDGDGSIDRYNIRICIDKYDPLYIILQKIFKNNIAYDEKRYMLRIKTQAIRKLSILEELAKNIVSEHKRTMIKRIMRKRKRFIPDNIILTNYKIEEILNTFDSDDLKTLTLFKFRKKQKYTYAYISFNKKNKHYIFSLIRKLFHKIELVLSLDLIDSIKEGNREYVVYNQKIVELINRLKMNTKRGEGR